MKVNTLYQPLNKKELCIACVFTPIFLAVSLLLGADPGWPHYVFALVSAALLAFIMRDFLRQTAYNLPLLGRGIWFKPLLAWVLNTVVCTVFNDLALLYNLPYFVGSGWGPVLLDIRALCLRDAQFFAAAVAVTVLVLPVIEEFMFRQTIFSLIFPKSRFFASLVSIALFTAFHVLPYIGRMDGLYLAIYGFQFIPMGLFLCWLYTSTDTIVSPILMHMLCNVMVCRTAWTYLFMQQ